MTLRRVRLLLRPPGGYRRVPFDRAPGLLRSEVAALAGLGSVRMVPKYADALRSVKAIWIDSRHQG